MLAAITGAPRSEREDAQGASVVRAASLSQPHRNAELPSAVWDPTAILTGREGHPTQDQARLSQALSPAMMQGTEAKFGTDAVLDSQPLGMLVASPMESMIISVVSVLVSVAVVR